MSKRTQDRQPIGQLGELRKVLTDLHPGHRGRNRTKFASNLRRCIRLQIKRIELARPTPHENENAPLGPDGQIAGGLASRGPKRRSESEQRQGPGLEDLPAVTLKNSVEIGTVR